jgi:SAM-dependent methyltransferase
VSLLPQRPKHWSEEAIWQDVEFGSYSADLPLWRELTAVSGGPVLELGAGSGRVALALAEEGVSVVAVELDPGLVESLRERAGALPVTAIAADIAELDLSGHPLAIAPLQVMQLLRGEQRARALAALATALAPGGRCAIALVDESTLVEQTAPSDLRPDMREVEGWVYSSEPLWVQVSDDRLRMRRLRERVAPDGAHVRRVHDDVLYRLTPSQLEAEAARAGLRAAERREIPSSAYEAGSIAVILEAP